MSPALRQASGHLLAQPITLTLVVDDPGEHSLQPWAPSSQEGGHRVPVFGGTKVKK